MSLRTVRMVPSTGLRTALKATFTERRRACAMSADVGSPALGIAEPLGEAAQDLGGDDARVAAGAHEGAMGDRLGNVLHRGVLRERLDLLHDGPKRERHVGAGVSVRDREHVELVDLLALSATHLGGNGEARAVTDEIIFLEPLVLLSAAA
jgi:hypothetical protein